MSDLQDLRQGINRAFQPTSGRDPREVATVVVNGRTFDDWESVMVQDRMAEPYATFRFTAAERDPLPSHWSRLQFGPGDQVGIYLGGRLALGNGFILTRQVAYDANQHAVQLQGVGRSWAAARGAIIDKDGNYDNMSFQEVALKVVAPFGVGMRFKGQMDPTPFKKLQLQPGEPLWDFLERIARPRGIIMGSDPQGNLVAIGQHEQPSAQELTEGYDIKRCQCIISIENTRYDFRVRGQTAGGDDKQGADASEQEAVVPGTLRYYSPLLTTAEQPVWNLAELQSRAANERKWNEGTRIECNITVYGWLRKDGELWRAGDEITVDSPMIMLGRNTVLKVETVTFTQDNESGTETTLQLRDPYYLNGKYNFNLSQPVGPQLQRADGQDAGQTPADQAARENRRYEYQPPPATSDNRPSEAPPAARVPDPMPGYLDEYLAGFRRGG